MCYQNDKIFFVSGSRITEGGADKKVESYNIETNRWALMPDMPEGRCRHSSCGFQQKFLYIFGGMSARNRVGTIIKLDLSVVGA